MAGWIFQQRWTSLLTVLLVYFAFSGATPVEKRSHHSGPDWIQDCWDHAENHIMNPFCPQNVTHCPDPPQISGGTFTPPTSTIVGTTVTYTCDDHYAMFGDDSIKCVLSANETVAWTKTPSCKLVCGTAPALEHGTFVTPDNSLVGTVVSYSCHEGYVFASEAHSIECLDGGNWGPGPECIPAPCTVPPTIDNGYTSGDDVVMPGATLTVHCDDMYKLQGTNTVTCLGTNNWSEPPVCEPKVCVAPPELTNGFIVLTGSTNTPKTTQTPSASSTSGAQQTTNAPTSGPTQTPTSGLPMSSSSIKKSPQTTSVIPYYPKTTPSTSYGPFTSIPPHTNVGTQTVTTSSTTVPTSASDSTTTVKIDASTAIIVDRTTENVDVTSRASTSTPSPTNEGTKSSVTLTTSPMETTSTTNSIQTTTEESEVIFTSTQEPPLAVSTIDYATDSKTTEVEPARTTEFEPIGTTESELIQITSSFMTIPTTTTDEPDLINPIEGGGSGDFDFTTTTEDYNTTILYNMTTDSDIEYSENGTDEIIDNGFEGIETSGNETGDIVDDGLEGAESSENGTDEIIDHNGIESIETIQNATEGIIDTENGTSEIIDTGSEGLETSENGTNDTNGIEATDTASSEGIESIEEVFTTTTGTDDYNTTILYNQTTDGDGLIDTDYYEYYEYETTFENETDEIGEMITDSEIGMGTTTTTEDYNTTILYNETTGGDLIDYYNYEYYYYYEYETIVNDTDEIGELVDTWSESGTNITDIDNIETVGNDTDEIGELVDIGMGANITDIDNVEGNDGTDDIIEDIENMEATNETDTTGDMENVETTNEPDVSEIEETTSETNTIGEPSQGVTDTTEIMSGVLQTTTLKSPPLKTEGTTMWNYFSPDDVPAADIEVSDEVANEDANLIGTVVQYKCNTGYSFKDPGTAVEAECVDNGGLNPEWTQLPECIPDCGTPTDVNHSSTYYNSTLEGAVAEYRCDVGYVLNAGTGIIECLTSGIWTPAPSCIPDCGAPAEIPNGIVNYGNTTLGGLAAYQCKHGYKMVGLEVTTCLETSTWTQEPTCNIDCGPVPVVANAIANRVENTTLTYTYECVERFNMEGNNTIVCIDDGTEPKWTRVPYCECIRVPVDIIFILDGSGSVNIDGFNDTLRFVSDIISRFPVETTRFGMIVFSSYAVPEFHLGQFVNNTGAMVDHINNSTYPAGSTATYDALKYARTQMFQPANGMRPNVSHAAIVVTDGQSDNFNETVLQAQLLRDVGVTIYSVGVGAYADHDELMAIASDDTYIFHVDDYSSIDQVAGPLADIACHAQHFRDEQIVMP